LPGETKHHYLIIVTTIQKTLNTTFVLCTAGPTPGGLPVYTDMLRSSYQNKLPEAGCDEAGRGCLAGPVYAAAVILPKRFKHPLLNDSKLMTAEHRYELREYIQHKALAWAVASVDHEEIDRINILRASFKAMHLALDQFVNPPGLILVDGHMFTPYADIPHKCMIKGDATYASIAAASVLAKTYRDDFMISLHEHYPQYGWLTNKGYGTTEHRKAIEEHGLTPYHRRSFQISSLQLDIGFESLSTVTAASPASGTQADDDNHVNQDPLKDDE
jgi:ribonuclease HII